MCVCVSEKLAIHGMASEEKERERGRGRGREREREREEKFIDLGIDMIWI